jgi:hypothetical protein
LDKPKLGFCQTCDMKPGECDCSPLTDTPPVFCSACAVGELSEANGGSTMSASVALVVSFPTTADAFPVDYPPLSRPEAPSAGYTASCEHKTLLSSSPVINTSPVEKSGAEGSK